MRPAEVRQFCDLDDTSRSLMKTAMNQLQLSARAYHRILKLARTIADLAGSEKIGPSHLAEALAVSSAGDDIGCFELLEHLCNQDAPEVRILQQANLSSVEATNFLSTKRSVQTLR